jgi:hypothetical protein
MKYMLLIYEDPSSVPDSEAAMEKILAEYAAFTRELVESKELVSGERLNGTDTATSVRVRGGKIATTDGPFAETKEQLGGFYLVDVADLDRALELAARLPAARTGVIEIRPLFPV